MKITDTPVNKIEIRTYVDFLLKKKSDIFQQ